MTAQAKRRRAPTLTLNLRPEELRILYDACAGVMNECLDDPDADIEPVSALLTKLEKLYERSRKGGS